MSTGERWVNCVAKMNRAGSGAACGKATCRSEANIGVIRPFCRGLLWPSAGLFGERIDSCGRRDYTGFDRLRAMLEPGWSRLPYILLRG